MYLPPARPGMFNTALPSARVSVYNLPLTSIVTVPVTLLLAVTTILAFWP